MKYKGKEILDLALKDELRKKNGLSVTFVTEEKYPALKGWQKYAQENQSEEDIKELYEKIKGPITGYSYFTGIGGLIDIDFDWEWTYHVALRYFGDRMDTRTIKTPNGGYRALFLVDEPMDFLDFKSKPPRVEIHGNIGHHVVVQGKALDNQGQLQDYTLVNDSEIRKDNDIMQDFIKFLTKINENCYFLEYKCIAEKIKQKSNYLTQDQRTSIGSFFAAENIGIGTATDFFRMCDDFDPEKTRDHLERLYNKDFKHPKCEKLMENFDWKSEKCHSCIRHNSEFVLNSCEIEYKESKEEISIATAIANEIIGSCELFTDERNVAYAKYPVGDHMEIWPINSRRFKYYLFKLGRELSKNYNIPSKESINSACSYIEAITFEQSEKRLNNRVAEYDGAFWYDLSNPEWEVIKITDKNWEIITNPPTILRRETHQQPQLYPVKDGDPWRFFDFVNVPSDKKLLVLVQIISYFIPDIPHPVLIIYGSPGSGKSSFTEFCRSIIDPSKVPKLTIPKTDRELMQNFDHHYAAFFDNLDTIPAWLSDQICRAVTGECSEHRALYTNDEPILRSYRRCVAINGVNIAATRTDLLDRSILLKLGRISTNERLEEKFLRDEFKSTLPEILGGILNVVVRAMRIYPSVKLDNLPRMADFAKWGYSIAEALGSYGDEFLKQYSTDEEERMVESSENHPLATAVIKYIEKTKKWQGSPTKLLEELETFAKGYKISTESKLWPETAVWLTRRLNEIEPILSSQHIVYSSEKKGKGRIIYLEHINEGSNDPSQIPTNTDFTDLLTLNESEESNGGKTTFKPFNYETVNSTVNDSKNTSKTFNNRKDSIAVKSVT